MDLGSIVGLIKESLFLIIVFGVSLFFAMIRGRQAIVNLILSLYLALLISLKFPYYGLFTKNDGSSNALIMIFMFATFTITAQFLFARLMPPDEFETAFVNLGKKMLFAFMVTILIMAFSFHVLPVTEFITPGPSIQSLFSPDQYFFWWLVVPLAALFFL